MTTTESPVKPALQNAIVLEIGNKSYLLDSSITAQDAFRILSLLACGIAPIDRDWSTTSNGMVDTIGERCEVAIKLLPVGGAS